MKYDHSALMAAERNAFAMLTSPAQEMLIWNDAKKEYEKQMVENKYWCQPLNVSMPVELVQETPFINSTQIFNFDFSISGPGQSAPGTNNVILGKNNICSCYYAKILIGEGANPNNRIYRSRGITPNDDALYNSIISIKFEESTLVEKIPGQLFRDVYTNPLEFDNTSGLLLINPQRVQSGELGTFKASIELLSPISTLVLSQNLFISFRLGIAYGQASAKR